MGKKAMEGFQRGAWEESGTRKDSGDKITQTGYEMYDAIKKRKKELADKVGGWFSPSPTPSPTPKSEE